MYRHNYLPMKKTLSIALLFIFLFAGCKKEERFCWKCALYKLNSAGYLDTLNPKVSTECDKTEKEIMAYEEANTISIKHTNSEGVTTGKPLQSMSCKPDK